MIKLEKVVLHNFLSYKDAELNLDNQGITLIAGINNSNDSYVSNGSGKSSLLNAVTYAIYGQTVEGLSGDSVVNKEAGTDSHVFLYFTKDNTNYRIERYRKGKHNNRNKLRLFANDTEVTLATNAKTTEEINHIFNLPYETYVNTIMYGQGDVPIFSQATDKGKKEILESLANTKVYVKARELSAEKQKDFQLKANQSQHDKDLKQSQLEQTKNYAQRAKQEYEQALAYQKQLKQQLSSYKAELTQLKQKLETAKANFSQVEAQVKDDYVTVPDKPNDIQQYEQKYAQLNYQIEAYTTKVKDYVKAYKDLDVQKVCPTCGQPVTNKHKEQERQTLTTNIKEASVVITQDKTELAKLTPVLEKKREEVSNASQASREAYAHNAHLDKQVNDAKYQVSTLQTQVRAEESKIQAFESQLKQPTLAQDFSKDITKLENEIKEADVQTDKFKKTAEEYGTLANKVFSRQGIQSMAMDLIVPFLNDHTNSYLARLSGSALQVVMSAQTLNANNTLSDKFDLQVRNASGASSYQACSTGEKKRIDVAIAFAIQDLLNANSNMGMNMAVYDECFDGLDEVGTENVISIMQDKQKDIGTIFVITHNEHLKPLFENVITVVKGKDGISRVINS